VSLEPVIREEPPQVGVVRKVDSEHVKDLPLIPVGGFEHAVARLDGGQLVCVGLDAYAGVKPQREKVVNNLKKNKRFFFIMRRFALFYLSHFSDTFPGR
jgi:hypothetical protein